MVLRGASKFSAGLFDSYPVPSSSLCNSVNVRSFPSIDKLLSRSRKQAIDNVSELSYLCVIRLSSFDFVCLIGDFRLCREFIRFVPIHTSAIVKAYGLALMSESEHK